MQPSGGEKNIQNKTFKHTEEVSRFNPVYCVSLKIHTFSQLGQQSIKSSSSSSQRWTDWSTRGIKCLYEVDASWWDVPKVLGSFVPFQLNFPRQVTTVIWAQVPAAPINAGVWQTGVVDCTKGWILNIKNKKNKKKQRLREPIKSSDSPLQRQIVDCEKEKWWTPPAATPPAAAPALVTTFRNWQTF